MEKCCVQFAEEVAYLKNHSFMKSLLLHALKTSGLVPIHRKNSRGGVTNYIYVMTDEPERVTEFYNELLKSIAIIVSSVEAVGR